MSINPLDQLRAIASREIDILTTHCIGVVLKDQDEADAKETEESLRAAATYMDVYFQLDTYPNHEILKAIIRKVSTEELPDVASSNMILSEIQTSYANDSVKRQALTELVQKVQRNGYVSVMLIDADVAALRDSYINNFVDLNPYYQNLKATYGIPIWKSRRASDFDLLHEPKRADDIILNGFQDVYAECQRYFMSVIYTKAFAKDMVREVNGQYINYYRAFCRFFICFTVIIKTVNKRLKNPLDANSMDEYILDNMLYSFGFTEFREFPVEYKRRIVLNINELIRHKGTDRIFIDILNIFDFKDINIFKYYLVKYSSSNAKKDMREIGKDVRFLAHNVNIPSLQEAVRTKNYTVHSFEDVTEADPYWQASKLEVGTRDFNYVNSKYFSIESSFQLLKETQNIAYFQNLVRSLRDNHEYRAVLELTATKISDEPIQLSDLLVAAQILMSDYYGIDDTIDFSQEGVYNVLSFNTNDNSELNRLLTSDQDDIGLADTQRYVLERAYRYGEIDHSEFDTIYKLDKQKMTNLRNLIRSKQYTETDVKTFGQLKDLYDSKFVERFNLDAYRGFTTYGQYLRSRNIDLHTYVDTIVTSFGVEEKRAEILYILGALTEYCKAIELQFDNRFSDVITSYINQMVSVFKSYTVTLKDFTIFYSFDENLFFSFFDKAEMTAGVGYEDAMQMADHMGGMTGKIAKSDKLLLLEDQRIASTQRMLDNFHLRDGIVPKSGQVVEDRFSIEDVLKQPKTEMNLEERVMMTDKFVIRVTG
jgi:hypothetical protein